MVSCIGASKTESFLDKSWYDKTIEAMFAVHELIRTTLAPKKMDLMIATEGGEITVVKTEDFEPASCPRASKTESFLDKSWYDKDYEGIFAMRELIRTTLAPKKMDLMIATEGGEITIVKTEDFEPATKMLDDGQEANHKCVD